MILDCIQWITFHDKRVAFRMLQAFYFQVHPKGFPLDGGVS